jgi:hypothetical protein
MSKETIKRKKLHSKLFTTNRLVILNEDTEETFSKVDFNECLW